MGRKTKIKEVPKKEAKEFLEQNHIQGSSVFEISFGLYYFNELQAVITGNKHHRQGHSDTLVLNRLAFKTDVSIAGGPSKLFNRLVSYAKERGYKRLISWSDNRWSEGNVYKKLEFELTENLPADYSYFSNQSRISKQSCQKKMLIKKGAKGDMSMTEKELALSLGLYRIYDCGKKQWSINL
jgi:N-acetylglutamate synthase-like GNAT family acetyltransferase